jgi:hypothetical protein
MVTAGHLPSRLMASTVVVILSLVVASHHSPGDVLFSPLAPVGDVRFSRRVVANTVLVSTVFEFSAGWLRPPDSHLDSLRVLRLELRP